MELLTFHLQENAAAIVRVWLASLQKEKRVAQNTLEAYGRDLTQFGLFLQDHLGETANIKALTALDVSDFRSFMARRRGDGIEARTLARQMSSLRSFFRFAGIGGQVAVEF